MLPYLVYPRVRRWRDVRCLDHMLPRYLCCLVQCDDAHNSFYPSSVVSHAKATRISEQTRRLMDVSADLGLLCNLPPFTRSLWTCLTFPVHDKLPEFQCSQRRSRGQVTLPSKQTKVAALIDWFEKLKRLWMGLNNAGMRPVLYVFTSSYSKHLLIMDFAKTEKPKQQNGSTGCRVPCTPYS